MESRRALRGGCRAREWRDRAKEKIIIFKCKLFKCSIHDKCYIMIKGLTQEQDITLVNIYTPKIGALKYIEQI